MVFVKKTMETRELAEVSGGLGQIEMGKRNDSSTPFDMGNNS